MAGETRRVRLEIWKVKISSFWQDFKRSKAGLFGSFLIVAFVFLAIFGPELAPYDPAEEMLAAPIALPQWFTMLPQFNNLPPSLHFIPEWTANPNDLFDFQFKEDSSLTSQLKRENLYVWSAHYIDNSSEEVEYTLVFNFTYNYRPPDGFRCVFRWRVVNLSETGYNLELTLTRYDGEAYSLWDSNYEASSPERSTKYSYMYDIPGLPAGFPRYVELGSGRENLYKKRLGFGDENKLISETFSIEGNYTLTFSIRLDPKTTASTFEVQIFDFRFFIVGRAHGLLGTDDRGRDIFSRVLYGVRVPLLVGLLVSVPSTVIGVFVGIISGFLGGFVDEASMRIVDLLMCIPVFPLLLVAIQMFGRNLFIVVFVIVWFAWMGLSRMIRSQVLSIREQTFVTAAISTGCKKLYILRRHILPNVMPLAFSSMILSVPAAIILESTLSFLGLGDPKLVTWGGIINEAMRGGALPNDAWWWLFTPGIAIVFICLGFVFVAHAFDIIVNPRLRTRR